MIPVKFSLLRSYPDSSAAFRQFVPRVPTPFASVFAMPSTTRSAFVDVLLDSVRSFLPVPSTKHPTTPTRLPQRLR